MRGIAYTLPDAEASGCPCRRIYAPLQRLDLDLAELNRAPGGVLRSIAELQRERPLRELAVVHVHGLLSVQDHDEIRAARSDLVGIPFAARLRHRVDLGDVDDAASAVARIGPLS